MALLRQPKIAARVGCAVLFVGCAAAAMLHNPVLLDSAVSLIYFLLLSASWNLMAGYAGQMSFAHMSFAVIGGYVTAFLAERLAVSPILALPAAGLVAALLGALIGLVTLGFRDIFLAIATFAFAGAFQAWAVATTSITGGENGMPAPPLFDMEDQTAACVRFGLGLVVVFYTLQWAILSSRWGVLMRAVRDREEVARGLGLRTVLIKVTVCSYVAFWAGMAGGYLGSYVGLVTPSMGLLSNMGLVLTMVVVGGMGRVVGPLLGTILFRTIDFYTRGYAGEYTMLVFAALMLVMMLVARDGLTGILDRLAARVFGRRQRWHDAAGTSAPGVAEGITPP
jgi:branched-chain amino acid transport system permease protein